MDPIFAHVLNSFLRAESSADADPPWGDDSRDSVIETDERDGEMDALNSVTKTDVTSSQSRAGQVVDYMVAFNILAAVGALVAAIAPALMATADAMTQAADGEEASVVLRESVSSYWDVDPRFAFWLPFTAAAVLLIVDSLLSIVSPNRAIFGKRYQNFFLGVSLATLTWFNNEDYPTIHNRATFFFFALFAAVMAYGALLGLTGRRVAGNRTVGSRQAERVNGWVSLTFFALLGVGLVFYWLDWINFFFFELYALVSFALHYVLSASNPFPYNFYEFSINWLNRLFRALKIMKS